MAVTHTTIGFKGTVDQIGEAKRMARLGPRFTVGAASEWRVTAAAGDRTVSISAGSGECCGVLDTTVAADTVALPANGTSSTGTRYDLIVARFRWTDPVTPVAFTYVQGIPGAGGPNIAGLTRTPGGQYDAVLAVVQVLGGAGALNANNIFLAAPVGSGGGTITVPQIGFIFNVVDGSGGDEMLTTDTGIIYRHNGAGWVFERDTAWQVYTPTWTVDGAATQPSIGNGAIFGRYKRTAPGMVFLEIGLSIGSTTQGAKTSGGADAPGPYRFGLPPGMAKSAYIGAIPGWFSSATDSGGLTGVFGNGATWFTSKADVNNADVGNGLLTAAGNFLIFSGQLSFV